MGDVGFIRRIYLTIINFFKIYLHGTWWMIQHNFTHYNKLKEIPNRSGETAIVTGGARGIGKEIVKQLLIADMRVIVACRDLAKGNKMIQEFRETDRIKSGSAECLYLDLCSLHSVRKFAKTFLAKNTPLHLLINNAGVMIAPRKMTGDGFESQFQINYLSHFLLTILLLPALNDRTGSGSQVSRCRRIVNVSSMAAMLGDIDPDDIVMQKFRDRHLAYYNSKLMQVVSSCYMNRRFIKESLPLRAYSVHPGVVRTELFIHFPFYNILFKYFVMLGSKSPEKGADTVVYVALAEELEERGGTFLDNCKIIPPHPQAEDEALQEKLWELSRSLTKLDKNNSQSLPSTTIMPDPFILVDVDV